MRQLPHIRAVFRQSSWNFNSLTDSKVLEKEFLKLVVNEKEIRKELMGSIPLRMRSAMEAGEMLLKI